MSIFLSHSSLDKELVRPIFRDLTFRKIRAWFDEAEIPPGGSLLERIREAIEHIDCLGVCLSPKSVESEWVQREVMLAKSARSGGKEIIIIPLWIDDCDLPDYAKAVSVIDFRDRESARAYGQSMERLARFLLTGKLGPPPSDRRGEA